MQSVDDFFTAGHVQAGGSNPVVMVFFVRPQRGTPGQEWQDHKSLEIVAMDARGIVAKLHNDTSIPTTFYPWSSIDHIQ